MKPYPNTQVRLPAPRLHAGRRLFTSAFERSQLIEYGDARAAEVDAYWRDLLALVLAEKSASATRSFRIIGVDVKVS